MSRSRISAGFHRLGVVFALPLILAAPVAAVVARNNVYSPDICTREFEENQLGSYCKDIVARINGGYTARGPMGLRMNYPPETKISDLKDLLEKSAKEILSKPKEYILPDFSEIYHEKADYIWAYFLLGLGVSFYVFFRAVGWVVDGFTGAGR